MAGKQHPAQEFRERLAGRRDLPPVGQLPGATPGRVAVMLLLANCADHDLIAEPGTKHLHEVTGLSASAVTRGLVWGQRVGLLERRGGGHRGVATRWRLVARKVGTHAYQSAKKGRRGTSHRWAPTPIPLDELDGSAANGVPNAADMRPADDWPWPSADDHDDHARVAEEATMSNTTTGGET